MQLTSYFTPLTQVEPLHCTSLLAEMNSAFDQDIRSPESALIKDFKIGT